MNKNHMKKGTLKSKEVFEVFVNNQYVDNSIYDMQILLRYY